MSHKSILWDSKKAWQSIWKPSPEVKARRDRIEAARLAQPIPELKRKFDKASGKLYRNSQEEHDYVRAVRKHIAAQEFLVPPCE